jgi:tRNA uridine 5-carboxymethylaminomethyl modification enzyme
MFTSRAEYRLLLREDNTEERLLEIGHKLGLVSENMLASYQTRQNRFEDLRRHLKGTSIVPNQKNLTALEELGTPGIVKPTTLEELLRRDEIEIFNLTRFADVNFEADSEILERVEIAVKYEGYIHRQNELVSHTARLEEYKIPRDFDFGEVVGLSNEEREKLLKIRPETLGQAGRISGVNPSAIQAMLISMKGRVKIKEMGRSSASK